MFTPRIILGRTIWRASYIDYIWNDVWTWLLLAGNIFTPIPCRISFYSWRNSVWSISSDCICTRSTERAKFRARRTYGKIYHDRGAGEDGDCDSPIGDSSAYWMEIYRCILRIHYRNNLLDVCAQYVLFKRNVPGHTKYIAFHKSFAYP